MASSAAPSHLKPESLEPARMRPSEVARPSRNLALGYLRGFLVVLVLAHHSVLAYIDSPPPQATSLLAQPPYWRAFMVIDHQHWVGFSIFTGFNDTFFMSLMFFVSGLFVWSSLKRKGNSNFVRERLRRLGVPFLFAAAIIAPLAYYPSYLLTTGPHTVPGYIHDWLSFGDWPTGPAWFIWLLLAFDLAGAALFAITPNFGEMLGRLASKAREHPVRFFLLLVAASAAAYIPMALIFGPADWTSIGPFQFQTARLFHYAVYFLTGIGVGAYGIERGLLAPDGEAGAALGAVDPLDGLRVLVERGVLPDRNLEEPPDVGKHREPDRRRILCTYLRLDIVRLPHAVRALRHAAPLDLRQPQRQRVRHVSNPLYVRVVAAARDSGAPRSRRLKKESWCSPACCC